MIDLTNWHSVDPFSCDRIVKGEMLKQAMLDLTAFHAQHCHAYRQMIEAQGFRPELITSTSQIPFLPVRLFKQLDLLSVPREEIVKTMTSSGTTGQIPSRIYLDRATTVNQIKALTNIVMSAIKGKHRMPMIILDSPSVIKDRALFSARGAGILGFSIFGRDKIFALNDDLQLDLDELASFLVKHVGQTILIFGFTFMIWQHLYKALIASNRKLDLSNAILIHGGGWKTLTNESVSPKVFNDCLHKACGITRVHDYYGMVEQTGSIFIECEHGYLHASSYSEIIIRRPIDFSVADMGESGIIEVLSVLPGSYPGHALLTDDEGVILGEDDCPCGRLGKYFRVLGRIKRAELRGCSDIYATNIPESNKKLQHHDL